MENRIKCLLLAGGIACSHLVASVALADDAVQVIQPELKRRQITPEAIDTQNFEIGVFYGVIGIQDFGSSDVTGLRLAYHVTEDFFFETTYGRAKGKLTSFEKLSGGTRLLSDNDRKYNYYDVNLGWNFLPGEVFIWNKYAFNSQIYGILGVGSTRFAGDDWFTVNLGAGLRLMLTDTFAWHLDFRDHVFNRDTFGTSQTTNNLEIHTGITVFF